MWEEAGIYLLREASLALEQWTWRRPQEAAGWPLGNLGVTGSQFSCSLVHPAAALALGTDSPHLARSVLPGLMGMGPGTGEDFASGGCPCWRGHPPGCPLGAE